MNRGRDRLSLLLPALFLLFLPLAFFHRALFMGEAFLPADLLQQVAPWRGAAEAETEQSAAWNVLRFDGIAQFYPWRLEAARQVQAGRLPLWNPHQFAAEGGTPLLANSQSAVLYPLTGLYYATPPERIWQVFGLSAALHLLIAAAGTYAFLRSLALGRASAMLGASTFALSGPVVAWLALPTFLAVSCWIPWLLFLIRTAHERAGTGSGRFAALGTGGVGGMMLLAGHLQMAFYGVLAAVLYALWLGIGRIQAGSLRPVPWLLTVIGAGLVAGLLALPHVLPAVELSRISHRTGSPSMDSYRAYSASALPPRNLVTLLTPDFFGHPNAGTYWNANNYAEWAVYVGVLPLLLAAFSLALPWRKARNGEETPFAAIPAERGFFAGLGLLTLLMAMGTPVNLPFFFGVPGYGQTGNPGRVLVLTAFFLACLAAIGLDALLQPGDRKARTRAAFAALSVPLLLAAVGASLAARYAQEALPQVPFGNLMDVAMPGLLIAAVLVVLGAALLLILVNMPRISPGMGGTLCVALAVLDLMGWGIGYNPTALPTAVYPVTPGIAFLQQNAADSLIAPLNAQWSMTVQPPRTAVLPPNALTVYGLHDLSGYDSLFPGTYKERVKEAGSGIDPSPPENGNMVFIKAPEIAVSLGARYIVTSPLRPIAPDVAETLGLRQVYAGDDLLIWENPRGRNWRAPERSSAYPANSFRIGLFLGLCGAGALAAGMAGLATAGAKRRTGT